MNHFPELIPKFYANLIDWKNQKDPLYKMVVPDERENKIQKYEKDDPIGDKKKTIVPGLIHRYPDRVLLNLTNKCVIHCRFCFRKNLLSEAPKNLTSPQNISKILNYLKKHKEIWEVIFSGGDPFTLEQKFLKQIIEKINKISHIKVIRFHTRLPVVHPHGVSANLLKALKKAKTLIIVVHINHPREITKEFQKAIKKLTSINASILSQTVLLKDVNDNAKTLETLFRSLVESGVKPYYLHHLDVAKGTSHFKVPISKGKNIMRGLKKNLSGIAIPEYMFDSPEGKGKIPIMWK